MIVENQLIEVKWHYTNKDYYISKGYNFTKFGETFFVKVEDLNPTSHIKIKIKCDHCDKIFFREIRNYWKEHDNELGDCCSIHNRIKAIKTCKKLYGVDWAIQNQKFKEKQIKTCQNKYGVSYISQSDEFKENLKMSMIKKYGVDNISKIPEVREKAVSSFYKNGTCPTSKPQYDLYKLINELYGNAKLNYPVGVYSLDIYFEINNNKIDVEYDGVYWHKNKRLKDKIRDDFLVSNGIKVFRISGNNKIPSSAQINESIQKLINENLSFLKITV